jgi:glycosyltransferase involved in cell wall biosynthesis
VAYVETQLIRELAALGVEIDLYVAEAVDRLPPALDALPNVRVFGAARPWRADAWYARNDLTKYLTGQAAKAALQARLTATIRRRHAERPYDFLYQFSQIELFAVRALANSLPPVVLHPEVHAAGELAWHRRETELARRCESPLWTAAVRCMLMARAVTQRRDMGLAQLIVAPSEVFADHVARDYGLPRERFAVVPNPIDLDRFACRPPVPRGLSPVNLVFVSRISVRKGVEMVVDLSHRLADLDGEVRIQLVGDKTLWSDYRPLLADLNPAIATYVGRASQQRLAELYSLADALLQPAHYEPFAITVGEALAAGMRVIASDEVGAREGVCPDCCLTFPAGDADALEAQVRTLIHTVRSPDAQAPIPACRAEAERLFAPEVVAGRLLEALERTAGSRFAMPLQVAVS